jgi:hypothetical protein
MERNESEHALMGAADLNTSNPPKPSNDAVHEAAHAIMGALVGLENIEITMEGQKPKCTFWGNNAPVGALLIAGFAGYWADLNLSGLKEQDSGTRATSDFRNFEDKLKKFVPSEEEWQRQVKHFGGKSESLVSEYKETIFELAKIIDERRTIPAHEVELLDCIKRVRQEGQKRRDRFTPTG